MPWLSQPEWTTGYQYDDLCQRIDLPPVTVNIKWDGKLEK